MADNMKGFDISEWQGDLDFTALKQAVDFAIARCSFGTARADNTFSYNEQGLRSNNIPHGFYHYAYPEYNTPQAEADFAIQILGQLQQNEIIALDFEENYSGDPVAWCLAWLQEFEAKTGYKPMLYINEAMINAHDWSPVVQNNNGLWLADWTYDPTQPVPTVKYWSVVAMWQYANNIQYAGQSVDGDVFEGDITTFDKYGFQSPNAQGTVANMFTLPSGNQVDLNNTDSMKVCATTWDAVVNLKQYVLMSDWNAIAGDLGLPAGTTKDGVDTAIKALQKSTSDAQAAAQTAQGTVTTLTTTLNETKGTLQQTQIDLQTANKQIETDATEIQTLKEQLTDSGKLSDEYVQLQKDFNTAQIGWQTQLKTDNATLAQLRLSSIYYRSGWQLFSDFIQRVLRITRTKEMPPLQPFEAPIVPTAPQSVSTQPTQSPASATSNGGGGGN